MVALPFIFAIGVVMVYAIALLYTAVFTFMIWFPYFVRKNWKLILIMVGSVVAFSTATSQKQEVQTHNMCELPLSATPAHLPHQM